MKALDHIYEIARQNACPIVLSEGEDTRIQQAAIIAVEKGIARPILLGDVASITASLEAFGAKVGTIDVRDPAQHPRLKDMADQYFQMRQHKGVTPQEAFEAVKTPLVHAAMMVRNTEAGGTVGGAVHTTADTVRVALQCIGKEPSMTTVSSFFLMLACAPEAKVRGGMIFSDCGLVVDPTGPELASIARASADSCRSLLRQEPKVALLSFSTAGSAKHESLDKIHYALNEVRASEPDLQIDGEIQFDAALDQEIRARKAPGSKLDGMPNVFVFPNLAAGNIGYKIAERMGGMQAIGPILQGLKRPANDLSRGCSVDDIVSTIAVTVVQGINGTSGVNRFVDWAAGYT